MFRKSITKVLLAFATCCTIATTPTNNVTHISRPQRHFILDDLRFKIDESMFRNENAKENTVLDTSTINQPTGFVKEYRNIRQTVHTNYTESTRKHKSIMEKVDQGNRVALNVNYELPVLKRDTSISDNEFCPKPYCHCCKQMKNAFCEGLNYVPKLPRYVESVTMTAGDFGLINRMTLHNLTYLHVVSTLALVYCGITGFRGNVFGDFHLLNNLDLSGNVFNQREIRTVLNYMNYSKLSTLKLDNIGLVDISPNNSIFEGLANTNLTKLSLAYNNIIHFSGLSLKMLKNLHNLNLNHNNILSINANGFNNLRELLITNNFLRHVPQFTNKGIALAPNLANLKLSNNKIVSFLSQDLKGLTNLNLLDIDYNPLQTIGSHIMRETPKLKTLGLRQTGLSYLRQDTFNSTSLTKLGLETNHIHFSYPRYKNIFANLPNLQHLFLDHNHLASIKSHAFIEIFKPLNKLVRLNMGSCRLYSLPANFTRILPSLMSVMLSSNKIVHWHDDTFAHAPNFTRLFLGNNRIKLINRTSFSPQFLSSISALNLEANPFSCTCDLMWFRNFLNETIIHITNINRPNAYKCAFPAKLQGKPLLSYKPTVQLCTKHELNLVLVLLTSIGGFALVLVIVSSMIYKYRWHLRYWWFVATAKMNKYELMEGGVFRYDAFISYSSQDRQWVIQTLLPTIEEKGYQLCLDERNFIPGRHVIDNIVEGIDASRRVILVLTDNFAQSKWCEWEVNLAQHKNLNEGNRSLILLKYKDINDEHMSKKLAGVIKERTYLEWREDEVGKRHFWQQLEAALAKPDHD